MAVRGNGSRSSLTIDELRWLSACTAFADAPSSPRSPSSPIPIPAKRSSATTEGITVGINDSLTLLRTKGLSRRHYQKSTKSSRAKAGGTASAFPDSSSLLYKVTPPASALPASPVGTSSAPASPVASSVPSKQSRNPRLSQSHRSPRSPSISHNQGTDFPPTARSAPSPRQFSKHPEWIYRRPKLSSSSSSCQSSENDVPRTRAPLPSFTSGPCLERGNKPGYSSSNESSFNRDFRHPPSPPSSFWSPHRKRYQADAQATGSTQWDNFDHSPSSPVSPKLSPGEQSATSALQPCRSASTSTSSSSESSRPHTPPLQHYPSPTSYDVMTCEPYPRSILTRTSSTSTQKHSPSIMVSRATRQRSGSCSKSVKFVEIPTVHYANIDWDWVIPDEEDSDVDTESDPEEEEEGSLPPSGLGKMLGFAEQAQHNKSVDTLDSVRTSGSSSGEKPSSLKRLVSLKRDTSLSSRKRTIETPQSSQKRPSISGPFALGTLTIPPPPSPSPPFVVSHAAKGTSVSLRSAPSMDSFRSVKSSGGRSILSVKSLRSLPGSLKTGAQGLKDWFKGRRVIVD